MLNFLSRVRSIASNTTFLLFAWLVLTSLPILWIAHSSLMLVQAALVAPIQTKVGDLGELPLSGSSTNLLYDKGKGDLRYAGLVDEETKKALVDVVRDVPAEFKDQKQKYLSGVDQLAFDSSQMQGRLTLLLLIFGGIAGVLGVQLRSIVNFVGHACFRNDLDPVRWWPYYIIRPMTGFILGLTLIAIVQSGFISLPTMAARRVLWWAALAFLAGFGEEEFTQRLRSVSKSIFGEKA